MEASNVKAMRDALVIVKRLFDGRLMWQTDIRKAHEAVNSALDGKSGRVEVFRAYGKWYAREGYEMYGENVAPYNDGEIELMSV